MPRPTSRADLKNETGYVSDDLVAYAQVSNRKYRLVITPAKHLGEYPMITVFIVRDGDKRPAGIAFSSYNAEELRAVRAIFELAFDLAEPVAEELDRRARQNYEEGSDAVSRLYRSAPLFALRERVLNSHYTGIPKRPEWLAEVVQRVRRRTAKLAGPGDRSSALPHVPQDDLEPKDDAPEDRGD